MADDPINYIATDDNAIVFKEEFYSEDEMVGNERRRKGTKKVVVPI